MEAKDSEERGRAIVQTLAVVVESMVQPSDSVPTAYVTRTKFEAFRAPGISIRDYLMRIHKYASCSPECFVLALVYIDRLHQMQGLILTDLNVHRVLITSVVLAAKFFDDHYFNNAYYAKVGGVPCHEMNELEVEFLLLTNFTLHVSTETYVRYYSELANHYFSNAVPGSHNQFRHIVAMDPEQDGQLIYVEEESPPRSPYEELQYHPHQQQQPQQQQQLQTQNGYAYPQETSTSTNPYATHHHHLTTHQLQYTQPVVSHNYQYEQAAPLGIPHNYYSHQSTIDHDGETQYTAATATAAAAEVSSAFTAKHTAPMNAVAGSASAPVPSSSNGMVFASSGRTSGQKRRQSVALGVNA